VEVDIARAERIAQKLGVLFTETRVPVIVVMPDGRFVSANDAAIAQYGYSLAELLAMRIHDLQAHARPLEEDLHRAATGDRTPLERRPHRRKDGSILWVVPTAGPITIDGETVVVSVLKDVTAILDAEQRARDATEASLRDRQLVLNAVVAMLGEHELEPAMQRLARAFAQGVGRATTVWLPETTGSRVLRAVASFDLGDVESRRLPTIRIDLDKEKFARLAWENGTGYIVSPETAPEGTIEYAVVARLEGRAIVAPLVGRSGVHGLLYGVGRPEDDPERALALATTLGTFGGMILEAVQHEARAQIMWQAASERLSDGIALLDHGRCVVRVNSAQRALLDLDEGDILRKPCAEVFSLCLDTPRCPHVAALEDQQRVVIEVRDPRSGKPLRHEIIPALASESGIAVIHVTHDLTEERAIRSQLVSTDRLATIGRLAAGVAHEINNPAAFVMVNLGVLRDRFLAGNARTQDMLAMLDESLNGMDRIREIVRDLKGFARERAIDVVDLAAVAQSAIRMAAHETRGRARVERVADEAAVVRVRSARIAQVVLNLVVNAAQAIPPGNASENRISVRTRRSGDKVRLEVSDTGPGVDPAVADRIFEPFFTTRERTGGTGLGLWLARGIVEEEGGTLTFHDEPGGGACFVVELPAAPEGSSPDVRTRDSVRIRASS
jgi:PAS domain S-box-containing protein